MIKKAVKAIIIILAVIGVAFSTLNFLSVDNMAIDPIRVAGGVIGTQGPGGPLDCTGPPLNCGGITK
ncbi:MAG: hypothetical protein KAT34_09085 [Candidatus Aminicenantes bacterium]|nr:hypothetical protein [Candidatus Aminicenantes bacterium]